MKITRKVYLALFALLMLFSCKTPKPREHHYAEYKPVFDQTPRVYVEAPSSQNVKLDTLVQVLSNLREEVYNFKDSFPIYQEFHFLHGELKIDVDSLNEKPPIFDTLIVIEKFLMQDKLVNDLFVPDSIKNKLKSDTVVSVVTPPKVVKAPVPINKTKPTHKKSYKPKKYVMPSYVRTVKGKQKYVAKRSPYRKNKSTAKTKPVTKPQLADASKPSEVQSQPVVKKEPKYFTKEQILADTTRDLLDADTIIASVFSSTGFKIGDSIPYYKGFSNYLQDSTIKIETKMIYIEIHDPSRVVKQIPHEKLSQEVVENKVVPSQINYSNQLVFKLFHKDEEDVFLKMIRVQGGNFKIGSNEFDEDERPEYNIDVSDFLIGKYEITNKVFCIFLNVLRCDSLGKVNRTPFINWKSRYSKIYWDYHTGRYKVYSGFEDFPVVNITWAAANKVCKEMGGQLPSEAQWEYAAKGGIYSVRYFINLDKSDYAYEQHFAGSNTMSDVGWFVDNSEGYCHHVGELAPNQLGLYDMCGNVWEWCYDNYDKEFYRHITRNNPICINSNGIRINRGGSWSSDALYCRLTNRNFFEEFQGSPYLGFRLMREWKK